MPPRRRTGGSSGWSLTASAPTSPRPERQPTCVAQSVTENVCACPRVPACLCLRCRPWILAHHRICAVGRLLDHTHAWTYMLFVGYCNYFTVRSFSPLHHNAVGYTCTVTAPVASTWSCRIMCRIDAGLTLSRRRSRRSISIPRPTPRPFPLALRHRARPAVSRGASISIGASI